MDGGVDGKGPDRPARKETEPSLRRFINLGWGGRAWQEVVRKPRIPSRTIFQNESRWEAIGELGFHVQCLEMKKKKGSNQGIGVAGKAYRATPLSIMPDANESFRLPGPPIHPSSQPNRANNCAVFAPTRLSSHEVAFNVLD